MMATATAEQIHVNTVIWWVDREFKNLRLDRRQAYEQIKQLAARYRDDDSDGMRSWERQTFKPSNVPWKDQVGGSYDAKAAIDAELKRYKRRLPRNAPIWLPDGFERVGRNYPPKQMTKAINALIKRAPSPQDVNAKNLSMMTGLSEHTCSLRLTEKVNNGRLVRRHLTYFEEA